MASLYSDELAALLAKSAESIEAAQVLQDKGFPDFAVARAYYAMLYAANAILMKKGLRFKKRSAVHAAFGREIARPGLVPSELHAWFLDAAKARTVGDYSAQAHVTPGAIAHHIERARQFLAAVKKVLETEAAAGK